MNTNNNCNTVPISGAAATFGRFDSIDQIRGAVMVLMALDHVRWFFTDISTYQPETLASTNLVLFLTRWVTHYCAPGFFLLAGIAIFLYATKAGSYQTTRHYLISRGILLIALELTIVGYAWVFVPGYSFGGVIWSLGCSFLLMTLLLRAPASGLLVGSVSFLIFHNLLFDGVSVEPQHWARLSWNALYQPGTAPLPGTGTQYSFLFPVLPWLAMMVLGYSFGRIYLKTYERRRRILVSLGTWMIVGFVVLRIVGVYGNPDSLWISPTTAGNFALQADVAKTIISFLNTEKYPPSLQFTLMTLGPIVLWLGLSKADAREKAQGPISKSLILFGRVPLFYYVCHLYVIHLLALATTTIAGQPNGWIGFGADPSASRPDGYGFGVFTIQVFWLLATAILYVLCRYYEKYKRTHDYAWLKYL